jgi:DNA-binding CsgD family transcriptional regulator
VGDLQDQADCLWHMAELDRRAGHLADAGTHLRESLGLAAQTGERLRVIDCLDTCAQLSAAMSLGTAAEFADMLIAEHPQTAQPRGLPQLSARERELVTLVARGRTDTQIAGQLYISVRTVRSHLDRIRDKTSCRRRADLTRLALQAGLV